MKSLIFQTGATDIYVILVTCLLANLGVNRWLWNYVKASLENINLPACWRQNGRGKPFDKRKDTFVNCGLPF